MKRKRVETFSDEDILYLIHRFLDDVGYHKSAEMVARAVGFKMHDLECCVRNGDWEGAEEHFEKFGVTAEDDVFLMNYINEIRKQKILETLLKDCQNSKETLHDSARMQGIYEELKEIQDSVNQIPSSDVDRLISEKRTCLMEKLAKMINRDPLFDINRMYRHLEQSSLWQFLDKSPVLSALKIPEREQDQRQTYKCNVGSRSEKRNDVEAEIATKANIEYSFPGGDITAGTDLIRERLARNEVMENQSAVRLIYTNSGKSLIALLSNGHYVVWSWPIKLDNPLGIATANCSAELMNIAPIGLNLDDEVRDAQVLCAALSREDDLLLSSSGTKISVFDMCTLQLGIEFALSPAATSCIALIDDEALAAVGKDDSKIYMYHIYDGLLIQTLYGHTRRITGLSYSSNARLLASSGADNQIIIWSTDDWHTKARRDLEIQLTASDSKPEVHFHLNGIHVLVSHESQLAIYDACTLQITSFQWIVNPYSAPIKDAIFSCDCRLIFTSFLDGTIRVFVVDDKCTNVHSICRIKPSAYFSNPRNDVHQYPTSLAAHPTVAQQFAIALKNGDAFVLEPRYNWGDSAFFTSQLMKASTSLFNVEDDLF